MPDKPRISIHEYIDARLDEQDERINLHFIAQGVEIERHELKNRLELKQVLGWVIVLTAPSWADIVRDFTDNEIAVAALFAIILIGLLLVLFWRTRDSNAKTGTKNRVFSED